MTISQYLGRGSTSRGAISINGALNMFVSAAPYLQTAEDRAAIITSIKNMQTAISKNPDITFTVPSANLTVEEYVDSVGTCLQPIENPANPLNSYLRPLQPAVQTTGSELPRLEQTVDLLAELPWLISTLRSMVLRTSMS